MKYFFKKITYNIGMTYQLRTHLWDFGGKFEKNDKKVKKSLVFKKSVVYLQSQTMSKGLRKQQKNKIFDKTDKFVQAN